MAVRVQNGRWFAERWWEEEQYRTALGVEAMNLQMAMDKLTQIFPADWVQAQREEKGHPVLRNLLARGLLPLEHLYILGSSISSLENSGGIDSVIKRLKNRDQYYGALLEVEIAAQLAKGGFTICFGPKLHSTKKA